MDALPNNSAQFGRELAAEVRRAIDRTVEPLKKRIEALESLPQVKYLGTFREGRIYDEGALVTHDGSIWHCNQRTGSPPGGTAAWTLAVKRGRDGKDAK